MFSIADGRKALWQWDLNQKLDVAGDCTEVHFLDRGSLTTLTVEVKDKKADIPNALLQKAGKLVVYAYIIDEQDRHTKVCEAFAIVARPKPAGYVYTETEVKTWHDLQAEIGDLSNLETEAKDNLVAAVNEVAKSGENDYEKLINLPSINGVELMGNKTGEELGLVPDLSGYATKDEIPVVPEALPNPNALTFTGAVNATYDGSSAVSVEIPSGGGGGTDISLGLTSASVGQTIKVKAVDESGKPTEWEAADMPSGGGGGGTSEEFILLAEVTLEEDVKKVTLPLSSPTKHFITRMWCPKTSATSNSTYLSIGINGSISNLLYYLNGNLPSKDNKAQCTVEAHGLNDGNWAISAYTNLGDAEGAVSNYNPHAMIPIGVKNNGIMQAESVVFDVVTNDATQYFPVGSILRVWGV